MAFPPRDPNAPPRPKAPPKGKSRSRRYAMAWVYREEPSNDDTALNWVEVKSTNVMSAFTALVKVINEERAAKKKAKAADKTPIRKTALVLVECVALQRNETLESFLNPQSE